MLKDLALGQLPGDGYAGEKSLIVVAKGVGSAGSTDRLGPGQDHCVRS